MNLQRKLLLEENDTSCRDCAVKERSALKNCTPECLELISSSKEVKAYLKGQRIAIEGSVSKYLYCVKSGKIKICMSDKDGHEMIIRFAKPGDIIGFDIEKNSEHKLTASAIEDVLLCYLDYNSFLQLIEYYPELSLSLIRYYKEGLQDALINSSLLARLNVQGKIAHALLVMQQAYGSYGEDNTLNLILSRKEIANLAFTTKEQVSKIFSVFRKQGIIKTTGNKKISLMNMDALHTLAEI